MRNPVLTAASLCLIVLAATALMPAQAAPPQPSTGPYYGYVATGIVDVHTYDNNPKNDPCIEIAVLYDVRIAVAGDATVSLSAGGKSTVAGGDVGGTNKVQFWAGICTQFDIVVEGIDVGGVADGGKAPYVVTVTRGTPFSDLIELG